VVSFLSELAGSETALQNTSQTLQYMTSSQAGHAQIPGHSHAHINSTGASPNGEGMCTQFACQASVYKPAM